MKETLLASAVILALFSTVSFADTSKSTPQENSPTSIDVGPIDVIIQSVPEDRDQVSLGFTKQIGNITYTTITQRQITDLKYQSSISALVIWKF